jgi:hypothetical protein
MYPPYSLASLFKPSPLSYYYYSPKAAFLAEIGCFRRPRFTQVAMK